MNTDQITACATQIAKKADAMFHTDIASSLQVGFIEDNKYFGLASKTANKVWFNTNIASRIGSDFTNTISHEIAHIVCCKLYPNATAHGKEWKSIHKKLGGDAMAKGQVDKRLSDIIKPKKSMSVVYTCSCDVHFLSVRLHNQIQAGKKSMVCKDCMTRLATKGVKLPI